jgi:ATP-dependent Clp protease, protease subunit
MPAKNTIELPQPFARKIFFAKDVTLESIEKLSKDIILINENDEELIKLYDVYDLDYKPKPIEIYIDSYGGFVYQIFGLVGIMEQSKTPIHTICTGAAMSCGFIMLIHGHKRFCYKHGTPMYHQLSGDTWGKLSDIENEVTEYKRLQNKIEEMTIKHTNISKDALETNRKEKRDWFMDAEEALKLGVIDEIIK